MATKTTHETEKIQSDEKVRYKKIGNTMFELVSYYEGDKTYTDIVKDILLMEMNRT